VAHWVENVLGPGVRCFSHLPHILIQQDAPSGWDTCPVASNPVPKGEPAWDIKEQPTYSSEFVPKEAFFLLSCPLLLGRL
jgi:hypothetical protein